MLILLFAWILIAMLQRGIRALRIRIASRFDDREAVKRAETLGRVARYIVAVVVSLVAGMLVLGELGVSLAPILGAAGVAGLAVGFGAQSLVKDFFTGFFLLLENQIRQGDVVKLGEHSGLVEAVITAAGLGTAGAGLLRKDDVLIGLGLGLAIEGLALFLIDWDVYERAKTYARGLEQFVP